jgi:hypothetical protein
MSANKKNQTVIFQKKCEKNFFQKIQSPKFSTQVKQAIPTILTPGALLAE